MNRFLKLLAGLAFWLAVQPAAALNIFACEPEWGALAKELAGDKASIYVATTALQDPHRIEAKPSLLARARSDLVVCTGAELEIGWMPLVQTQSANPKIQAGQPGYFEAARQLMLMDIPQRVDRALGDVHAAGNPHIHLDPANIARVGAALAERMAQLDPPDGAVPTPAPGFSDRAAELREGEGGGASQEHAVVVYHNTCLSRDGLDYARSGRRHKPVCRRRRRSRKLLRASPQSAKLCCARVRRSARGGMAIGAREDPGAHAAIHGRGTRKRGTCSEFDDTRRGCLRRRMTFRIDLGILWPAFVAGLLVTATHAPLGVQVLGRGIVFIDLAIAQVAGLGVIFADSLGFEAQGWGVQGAALAAALAGALLLTWTERRWPEVQEAIIGTTSSSPRARAAAARGPTPTEGSTEELLFGQILWVNWPRLLAVALVMPASWLSVRDGRAYRPLGFYLLFASAVTLSVHSSSLHRFSSLTCRRSRPHRLAARASRDLLLLGRRRLCPRVACVRGARPAFVRVIVCAWRCWRPVFPMACAGPSHEMFFRAGGRSNIAVQVSR